MAKVPLALKNFFAGRAEYWKLLAADYKTVVIDTMKEAKTRPVKAGVIGTGLAALGYAYKTNPTERDLLGELAERRQLLVTLPNAIHNRLSDEALSVRTKFLNQNRLEHIDCFFFSLLVQRPNDLHVKIYESQDPNLRSWWFKEIYDNLVDIGAFNRWYRLNESFLEYDVNKDDLQDLVEDSKQ